MSRRLVLSTTDASGGATYSSVCPVDVNRDPVNLGLGLIVTGTANCTVQHTFDDVWSSTFNAATATWFSHATITSVTANTDGNYAFPIMGLRLKQNSGSGSAQLVVVQAGIT